MRNDIVMSRLLKFNCFINNMIETKKLNLDETFFSQNDVLNYLGSTGKLFLYGETIDIDDNEVYMAIIHDKCNNVIDAGPFVVWKDGIYTQPETSRKYPTYNGIGLVSPEAIKEINKSSGRPGKLLYPDSDAKSLLEKWDKLYWSDIEDELIYNKQIAELKVPKISY